MTMAAEPSERAQPGSPDLRALIARSAAGDQDAFAAFYDETSRVVFGVALRVLGDRAEAEEATADVFMQVWRTASRFDASRGSPIAWLLMLTRSRAIDRLRVRRLARQAEQPLEFATGAADETSDPGKDSWLAQQGMFVRGALAQIPLEQRMVLELAYFQGLTHLEIAERLTIPVGTAKTRIRLGMLKLREALAPMISNGGVF
jgi:RNA polymerase sigma-70 factor (ECF subfamily)